MTHQNNRERLLAFTAHGSDPDGRLVSFNWSFGDGRGTFGRHVSHLFRTPGTYRVMLRATDSWGNWASASQTIQITPR
jgi:PKD repeat protein